MFTGFLTILGAVSCSNDETYDFPGDSMNRVYIKPYTGENFTLAHTPIQSVSSLDFKFPVYVTQNHEETITATLGLDNSLVDAYNAEHGTGYGTLPENALNIDNGTVTIFAGEYCSSDSVHITIDENMLPELRNNKGYLIPLRLVDIKGGTVAYSSNMNIVYLIVDVDVNIINNDVDDSNPIGTRLDDRTGWTAYVEEKLSVTEVGLAANLFDDDLETEWKLSSDDIFHFVVDMNNVYNVTAIQASYSYYGYYEFGALNKGIKLEYSLDGVNWEGIGTVSSNYKKNINLYSATAMRYIRIAVPVTSSYSGDMASVTIGSFNVYVE